MAIAVGSGQAPPTDEKVRARVEEWAKRLIDLSARNRLINFRPTRRTTIVFTIPSPDEIASRLLLARSWRVYLPRSVEKTDGSSPAPDLATILREDPPGVLDLVATEPRREELERSLVAVSRKAQAIFDDRGMNVLYIAWSLLKWTEPGATTPLAAPIALIPVELKRADGLSRFEVVLRDDQNVGFNPALRAKLANDFGLELPEFDIEDVDDLGQVTAKLESLRSIAPERQWEIQPYAAMGLFSHSKEPIYRDLMDHANEIAGHPAIVSLALGTVASELTAPNDLPVPTEEELDALTDPSASFSVLDADSTQRVAVEAAIRGHSFVLLGPPGTGKSQTIANIITEFAARGRSVLFVSEKAAALDVVTNRLIGVGLGDIALTMHGAGLSRSAVVRELCDALDSQATVRGHRNLADDSADIEVLDGYASAMHEVREPLGATVFEILGQVASATDVPVLPAPPMDPRLARKVDLQEVLRIVDALTEVWSPVDGGHNFVWRHAKLDTWSESADAEVEQVVVAAISACENLRARLNDVERKLQMDSSDHPASIRRYAELAPLADSPQRAPLEWLVSDDVQAFEDRISTWVREGERREAATSDLAALLRSDWSQLTPVVAGAIEAALSATADLTSEAFAAAELPTLGVIVSACSKAIDECEVIANAATELRAKVGVRARGDRQADLGALVEVARISQSAHRPVPDWLGRTRLDAADQFFEESRPSYLVAQRDRAAILEGYEPAVLEADQRPLLERMKRHHGHVLSYLRSSYRADRRYLTVMHRSRHLSATVIDDLETMCQFVRERDVVSSIASREAAFLGPYAKGIDTDLELVAKALASARRIVDLSHDDTDWSVLARVLDPAAQYDQSIDRVADEIDQALDRMRGAMDVVGPYLSDQWKRRSADVSLGDLRMAFVDARARLVKVIEVLGPWQDEPVGPTLTVGAARAMAAHRLLIGRIDATFESQRELLAVTMHELWQGPDTDWSTVPASFSWACAVRDAWGDGMPPQPAADALRSGSAADAPWSAYLQAVEHWHRTQLEVASLFEPEHSAVVVAPALAAPLGAAATYLNKLHDRRPQLKEWTAFCAVGGELQQKGWGAFLDKAKVDVVARDHLHGGAERAWMASWVDAVSGIDPRLRDFSRTAHDHRIEAFRSADIGAITSASERVRAAYDAAKPQASVKLGEPAILLREGVKKRRHLPTRTLLERISHLLPSLKPCLMMSPLSVSQYLAPSLRFDLVIFDEASQVPPEDAINCIYRGGQLIVAGDPKQLPPTDFFQRTVDDGADEVPDDAPAVGDVESVLDLASPVLDEHMLRWHYRSLDDSLIAFSNHEFYDGRLITFPCSSDKTGDLGVSFVHVPDGLYERGTTQRNKREAAVVAATVAAEMKRHPEIDYGIVAFSSAQEEAIQDEWDKLVRADPGLEEHAKVGRLHGLFIKNLETVQGDERDVIVFSIGYGRDTTGRLYRNFGPLNRESGWRRLNVAATRARRRVIVVSSMHASDLAEGGDAADGGRLRGSELLRGYLDYAEHGVLPHRVDDGGSRGLADSPFEEEVARVIRDLGWETVPQVGASRYRIDIGVRSRRQPGRYCLGVECDGAMYHSAKTARDRDRLRQSVLVARGWRLHRIWSQSWFTNRSQAVEQLRGAIEAAEDALASEAHGADSDAGLPERDGDTTHVDSIDAAADASPSTAGVVAREPSGRRHRARPIDIDDADALSMLSWIVPYPRSALPRYQRIWLDFHSSDLTAEHVAKLGTLVESEGPVHIEYAASRLGERYGYQRVGSRMQEAVEVAADAADRTGRLKRRGPFLWPVTQTTIEAVRIPVAGHPETRRKIEHIPPEEIDVALLRVVESAFSISEADLRVAVARVLGFDRTGEIIGTHVDSRIFALKHSGRLVPAIGDQGLTLAVPLPALPRTHSPDADGQQPAETEPPSPLGGYRVGMRVRHPLWGVGLIVDVDGDVVEFKQGELVRKVSTKHVDLKDAGLVAD